MAQPLFMEVTDAKSNLKVILGLAHITVISPGDNGGSAFIRLGEHKLQTVETYDQIRRTLGSDMGGVRWGV